MKEPEDVITLPVFFIFINMKKRLLITLGCSLTEGEGCYDFTFNPKKIHIKDQPYELRERTLYSFHKNGWPNKVGQALNFDKVINLGSSGSANSAHLKLFTDKIIPSIVSLKLEYDIFLIWLMTEPSRFSFFTEDSIANFVPSNTSRSGNNMESGYLKEMKEFTIGPLREQMFYMKLSESLFRDYGIKPLYAVWNNSLSQLYKSYQSPYFLSKDTNFKLFKGAMNKNTISEVEGCRHPNEKGYEVVASRFVEEIKKSHPHFVCSKPTNSFDWKWDGERHYVFNSKRFI